MVALEGLELVVTAQDLEATRLARCRCPIAVAFSRVFGQTALVNYESDWRIDGTRRMVAIAQVGRRRWILPDVALEFMRRWDQGIPCRPFSFPLPKEVA